MADHTARIAEIQAILRAGASTVKIDGVEMTYDFAQLRRELRRLMAEDNTHKGRRPVASTINLGNG